MGRKLKNPPAIVAPVNSKKQLMDITATCTFLGGLSRDSLDRLRNDPGERFPIPLQMLGSSPRWSVEQLERWVDRKQKEVESLSA